MMRSGKLDEVSRSLSSLYMISLKQLAKSLSMTRLVRRINILPERECCSSGKIGRSTLALNFEYCSPCRQGGSIVWRRAQYLVRPQHLISARGPKWFKTPHEGSIVGVLGLMRRGRGRLIKGNFEVVAAISRFLTCKIMRKACNHQDE